MNRRHFLFGCAACAVPKIAWAQDEPVTIGGRTFSSSADFIRQGRRCGTPEPSVLIRGQTSRAFSAFRTLNIDLESKIVVPVHVHVIHKGDEGKVSESSIDSQIEVLDNAYKKTNVGFTRASLEYVDKEDWYEIGPPPANPFADNKEAEMKRSLGKNQTSALNCYILKCSASLLGWATFPWEISIDLARDGVVILNESLPSGAAAPFNEGDTATHEIGHWLGLFHTFQGACDEPGDAVSDTPFQSSPTDGCPTGRDTCPALPGLDPITNFMDYSADACMLEFSSEQIARMRAFIALFRPGLLPATTVQSLNLRERLQGVLE